MSGRCYNWFQEPHVHGRQECGSAFPNSQNWPRSMGQSRERSAGHVACVSADKDHYALLGVFYNLQSGRIAQKLCKAKVTPKDVPDSTSVNLFCPFRSLSWFSLTCAWPVNGTALQLREMRGRNGALEACGPWEEGLGRVGLRAALGNGVALDGRRMGGAGRRSGAPGPPSCTPLFLKEAESSCYLILISSSLALQAFSRLVPVQWGTHLGRAQLARGLGETGTVLREAPGSAARRADAAAGTRQLPFFQGQEEELEEHWAAASPLLTSQSPEQEHLVGPRVGRAVGHGGSLTILCHFPKGPRRFARRVRLGPMPPEIRRAGRSGQGRGRAAPRSAWGCSGQQKFIWSQSPGHASLAGTLNHGGTRLNSKCRKKKKMLFHRLPRGDFCVGRSSDKLLSVGVKGALRLPREHGRSRSKGGGQAACWGGWARNLPIERPRLLRAVPSLPSESMFHQYDQISDQRGIIH